MPTLTIPEEHASGLSKIMELSPDDSDHVASALRKAQSIKLGELTALVLAVLPSLAVTDVREIVATLLSLYAARTSMDMTVDTFVEELISAVHPTTGKKMQVREPGQLDALRKSLKGLLGVRPLSMISKARRLHTDHENTFCNVRVVSDLRAVFDADVGEKPTGFVMAHILKLGYHHSGKHKNLYVAMDKIDIDNLMSALQRTKAKATTLNSVSNKAGFDILAD